jgi:mannose-6-phosphate isomerase-like protein (cupin superfamily)
MKIFTETRPWGQFEQFTHNESTTVKILTIMPNEELSLQSHTKRSEFVKIIKGDGTIQIEDNKYDVVEGDEHTVPINAKHRVVAGPNGLVYLEISLGDFEEEDEVRYEDNYGRT